MKYVKGESLGELTENPRSLQRCSNLHDYMKSKGRAAGTITAS